MAGMSVDDVTAASGIPYESARRYLAGERAIDVEVLEKLAGVFGLSAGELLVRAQERLDKNSQQPAAEAGSDPAVKAAIKKAAPVKKAVAKAAASKRSTARRTGKGVTQKGGSARKAQGSRP